MGQYNLLVTEKEATLQAGEQGKKILIQNLSSQL